MISIKQRVVASLRYRKRQEAARELKRLIGPGMKVAQAYARSHIRKSWYGRLRV